MTKIPQFRAFCDHDLSELEQMIFTLLREDAYGEVMSRQKIQRTIQELLKYPEKGNITMFCLDEVVVGYAIAINYWSNEYGGDIAFIDEFYVKPPWRGKGIGISFFKYVATVKAAYVKGLQVEVTPINERAFVYYSRQGFEATKNLHLFKKL